jgi:hypothetical protein
MNSLQLLWVGLVLVYSMPAFGEPLSCAEFKSRLVESIHAGGDKVLAPASYASGYKEQGASWNVHKFTGIAGLDGSIECTDDDWLVGMTVETELPSNDSVEANFRLLRLKSLTTAALCAIDQAVQVDCASAVERTAEAALGGFIQSRARGEYGPHAEERTRTPAGTDLYVWIVPGHLSASVSAPPPRDAQGRRLRQSPPKPPAP